MHIHLHRAALLLSAERKSRDASFCSNGSGHAYSPHTKQGQEQDPPQTGQTHLNSGPKDIRTDKENAHFLDAGRGVNGELQVKSGTSTVGSLQQGRITENTRMKGQSTEQALDAAIRALLSSTVGLAAAFLKCGHVLVLFHLVWIEMRLCHGACAYIYSCCVLPNLRALLLRGAKMYTRTHLL
jgi:hypothetical protein